MIVPPPNNEPVHSYAPGTAPRAELEEALGRMAAQRIEIPLVIAGKQVRTGKTQEVRMPHEHKHVLATFHEADASHVEQAIAAAMAARTSWGNTPFHEPALGEAS